MSTWGRAVILVAIGVFVANKAVGSTLRLVGHPARTNGLQLQATLTPGPVAYTVVAAETVPDLRTNRQVVAQGECTNGLVTVELEADKSITSRFFFVREQAIGITHSADVPTADQERRVQVGPVTLVVPPGVATNPTVATVGITGASSAGIMNQSPNVIPGTIYDVRLGTNTFFDPPLTIEIPYDPGLLNPELPEAAAVTAGYWLDLDQRWVPVTSEVDTNRHMIRVQTSHLSLFSDAYFYGYLVEESANGNFRTYYDPKTGISFEEAGISEPAKNVAIRANCYLEEAYAIYLTNGFRALPKPVICAFASSKTESEPQWAGKSGYIYMARVVQNETYFRQGLAHELFHAVQNRYYDVFTAALRKWWHEAAAEYAAWGLVLKKSPRYSSNYFRFTFFSEPLWTADESHEYGTANFIGRMIAESYGKLKFNELWDELAPRTLTTSLLSRMNSFVAAKTGYPLGSQYRYFTADVLLNTNSLLSGEFSPWATSPPNAGPALKFRPQDKAITNAVTLPAGYTAGLIYVLVEGNSNQPVRKLEAKPLNMEGSPIVEYYFMGRNRDGVASNPGVPLAIFTAKNQSLLIDAKPGEYLCFLASNSTESPASVTMMLSEKSTNLFKEMKVDIAKPNFMSGAASLILQARARVAVSDGMYAAVTTNSDSWGSPLSIEATVARMSSVEPVEIDLAENAFDLTLRTTTGNTPSDGNSTWTTLVNLDTKTETTLSNPRLFFKNPDTGLETEMPLKDRIIVPAETYIRYVSLGFDFSQKMYLRQPNGTWKLDSDRSGSGSSATKIEYIRFNIYK